MVKTNKENAMISHPLISSSNSGGRSRRTLLMKIPYKSSAGPSVRHQRQHLQMTNIIFTSYEIHFGYRILIILNFFNEWKTKFLSQLPIWHRQQTKEGNFTLGSGSLSQYISHFPKTNGVLFFKFSFRFFPLSIRVWRKGEINQSIENEITVIGHV